MSQVFRILCKNAHQLHFGNVPYPKRPWIMCIEGYLITDILRSFRDEFGGHYLPVPSGPYFGKMEWRIGDEASIELHERLLTDEEFKNSGKWGYAAEHLSIATGKSLQEILDHFWYRR